MNSSLQSFRKRIVLCAVIALQAMASAVVGQGIPEPSLIMYGAVRNLDEGNNRLISGTLTWEFQPVDGGPSVILTTSLTNINDQFSYILQVPWETDIGAGVSPNTLRLLPFTTTGYDRSQVFLGTNQAVFISASQAMFEVTSLDRGRIERVDLQVSLSCLDSDGNGICDWWEREFFGELGIDPNADFDGDGFSNLAEAQAGTDPRDADSMLAFIHISNESTTVNRIEWSSVSGRIYTVQRSSDLLAGFTNLAVNISATEPRNVYQDTNAVPPGPYFYRIRLQP